MSVYGKCFVAALFVLLIDATVSIVEATPGLYLDGNDEFITIPHFDALQVENGDFSYVAFVKLDGTGGTPGDNLMIFAQREGYDDAIGNAFRFFIDRDTGVLRSRLGGGPDIDDQDLIGFSDITDNLWHQVAFTRSGNTCRLYVDGALEDEATFDPFLTVPTSYGHRAGAVISPQGDRYRLEYIGYLDELSVWDRALTGSELSLLMINTPDAGDADLMAYWDFDENTGQIVGDGSGNNFDGHLGINSDGGGDGNDPAWTNDGYTYTGFYDDFSGDLSDWTSRSGSWSINGSDQLYGFYSTDCGTRDCIQGDISLNTEHQISDHWRVQRDFTYVVDSGHGSLRRAECDHSLYSGGTSKTSIGIGDGGWGFSSGSDDRVRIEIQEYDGTWDSPTNMRGAPEYDYDWEPSENHIGYLEKHGNTYYITMDDPSHYFMSYVDNFQNGNGEVGCHIYGTVVTDNYTLVRDYSPPIPLAQKAMEDRKWYFIGLPVQVSNGNAEALFGASLNNTDPGVPNWRVSRWDESGYRRYGEEDNGFVDDQDPPDFEPGLGFWVMQDVENRLFLEVPDDLNSGEVSRSTRLSVDLDSQTGDDPAYNQMANPYLYRYVMSVSQIENVTQSSTVDFATAVSNGWVNGNLYSWDPESGYFGEYETTAYNSYYPNPWDGFWLVVTTSDQLRLLFTPQGYSEGGMLSNSLSEEPPEQYVLRLAVMTPDSGYMDRGNVIGICENASDEYDPADGFELSPMGENFVHMYFSHPEWPRYNRAYTKDIRAGNLASPKDYVATVRVYNVPNQELILSWPEIDSLDIDYDVSLVEANGETIELNLRQQQDYRFTTGTELTQYYSFTFRMSGSSIDPENDISLPSEFGIHDLYPNPFNDQVRISYGLPEARDVKLTVFNILGQQVARLAEGNRTAGLHHTQWHAKNMASGVYLVKLEAAGQNSVRKVQLIR